MAVTKIKPVKSTLSKALDYIQNPDKTDGKMLVSSFGCSYETADIEFEYTLSQALQKGNNLSLLISPDGSIIPLSKSTFFMSSSYNLWCQNGARSYKIILYGDTAR